jgi:ABC-type transport system involved in cytochrome bd biosynthesis fused ATPase/permease subunit
MASICERFARRRGGGASATSRNSHKFSTVPSVQSDLRLSTEERAKITDAELWKLMQLLQIDFKRPATQGLDTIVGKNGIKLSGARPSV